MDVKNLILAKINADGEVKAAEIVKETGYSRVYVNRFFQELREQGRILLVGKANKARYIPATRAAGDAARSTASAFHRFLVNENLKEDEVLHEIKRTTGIFNNLKTEVAQIVSYAFPEMLNNAIEHSQSKRIEVKMEKDEHIIHFKVIDTGVGIFNNLIRKLGLENEDEAIGRLLKGKLTTAPSAHSGEGIFFSSRAADNFIIRSSNKKIIFNNLIKDQFVKTGKWINGTRVAFSIDLNSARILNDVFRRYTDNSFEFKKTEAKVRLYQLEGEFLSRSQARRIVSGLEKFSHVMLDFKGVKTIGQGFADEIFRVWKQNNPGSTVSYENAGDDVMFMIKHVAGEGD